MAESRATEATRRAELEAKAKELDAARATLAEAKAAEEVGTSSPVAFVLSGVRNLSTPLVQWHL